MVKLFRKITIVFLFLFASVFSIAVSAQTFTIDPENGVIDPIWGNYAPIPANNTQPGEFVDTGEYGDIVGVKFVAEMPNPSKIYFQVDGYDVLDTISVKLDCDGDGFFTSKLDREMYFIDISELGEGGEIEGEVDYTQEFLDSADEDEIIVESSSFAEGEYIVKEVNDVEGTVLQSFEAVFDLEADDSNILAPCFGPAMSDSWKINYQFDSGSERTFVVPLQVDVTAVTMDQQSAESSESPSLFMFTFFLLLAMTISLLYGYSYHKRKNV